MLINQTYIKSESGYLLCVQKTNNLKENKGIVVLIPGFSQSKSDIDYFMSRLGNCLVNSNFMVLMIDLFGHGDSYGTMDTLSWDKIHRNFIDISEYLNKEYPNQKMHMIVRGFYGNIVLAKGLVDKLHSVTCINPVLNIQKVHINSKKEIVSIETLLENKENEYLFTTMGSEITNIRSQNISSKALSQIVGFNICMEDWKENIVCTYNNVNNNEYTMEYQSNHCFLRDNDWQNKLINQLLIKIGD